MQVCGKLQENKDLMRPGAGETETSVTRGELLCPRWLSSSLDGSARLLSVLRSGFNVNQQLAGQTMLCTVGCCRFIQSVSLLLILFPG